MYKLRNKYIYRDIEKEREKEEYEIKRRRHLNKEYQSKFEKNKNNKTHSNNIINNKQQNCYISNNSSNNDEMPYHNISSVTSEMKCTEDSRYRNDEHLDKNNNGDNLYPRQHSCIMFSTNLPLDQSSPSHNNNNNNNNKYTVRKIYTNHNKKSHSLKFNNDIKSSSSSSTLSSSSESESPVSENKKSNMIFNDMMDINKSCMDSCFGYTDYIDESENVSNETVIITKSLIKENSDNRYQYKFSDVNDENYLYVNYK